MIIKEPTHKEIIEYLGCIWRCEYGEHSCQCYDFNQFPRCYEEAKKRLTSVVLTPEEIEEKRRQNQIAMKGIQDALDNFHSD